MRTNFALLAGVLLIAAVGVTQATATAPGTNGQIAYRTYFDLQHSRGALFTMGADGSGKKQISRPPRGAFDDQPSWAPDGSLIAFTRCAPDLPCRVYVVRPDGSGARRLGACGNKSSCPDDVDASFSSNSRKIVFTESTGTVRRDSHGDTWIQHSALTVMDRNGGNRHRVFRAKPWSGDLRYATFSPNGKQLVFDGITRASRRHPPRRQCSWSTPTAHTFASSRRGPRTQATAPTGLPTANGFFHTHEGDGGPQSQYFLIHPDGSGRQQVTHFADGTHVASASFSPDGSSIVFAKGPEGGNIDVYTMGIDGTKEQRLTQSRLWESAPTWGPAKR